MKNIAFAKIGKSVKFKTNNYSPVGGDNEASCVLRALANNNPDKTFYVVGRSDFGTLTENEVINILKHEKYWDNENAWRNFGDNENNFATIGNQQSLPETALVEKIINSLIYNFMIKNLGFWGEKYSCDCDPKNQNCRRRVIIRG